MARPVTGVDAEQIAIGHRIHRAVRRLCHGVQFAIAAVANQAGVAGCQIYLVDIARPTDNRSRLGRTLGVARAAIERKKEKGFMTKRCPGKRAPCQDKPDFLFSRPGIPPKLPGGRRCNAPLETGIRGKPMTGRARSASHDGLLLRPGHWLAIAALDGRPKAPGGRSAQPHRLRSDSSSCNRSSLRRPLTRSSSAAPARRALWSAS